MKKYIFPFLLILLTLNLHASPLHTRLKHTIIIDTDCSINDLRAVSILISHPGITVKAIIVSEGQVTGKEGYARMGDLLHELNADTIPVFHGESQIPVNSATGKESKMNIDKNFRIFPPELFQPADSQLTLVCLGPLTNITREIENNTVLRERVEEVIWFINSANPFEGFNYEHDPISADRLLNSGIRIDAISNLNKTTTVFDTELMNLSKTQVTNISKAFCITMKMPLNPEEKGKNISRLSEELVALFLGNHELFELSPLEANPDIRYNINYSDSSIKGVLTDMITGQYKSGHFVAFYGFPLNPELYVYDVRQIMESAIIKYGIEEWKACTLTDEFHGHLGVFSIVGAKMGIRARDYFGIGTDLLEIGSYAGSIEPFSCLNDGLQVSTGATLGQGSIHLINDSVALPQAVFTFKDQSVVIKLKDEYLKALKSVIEKGIRNYGLQDEDYWNLIRQTSIKYWLEWDRNEIFDLIIL